MYLCIYAVMDLTGTRDQSRAEPESVPVAVLIDAFEDTLDISQESVPVAVLIDAFEDTLDISQDAELTESAAPEEDSREETLKEDGQRDGQTDGQTGGQTDGQTGGQTDGQTGGQTDGQVVHPPAAESSSTESKWAVGAQCRTVWSEDGRVYPATVVSLDGERCRVRFNGYGNHEDVDLKVLQSPAPAPRQNSLDWRPGSRCRAVYSEDGLVYPAVLLWVKGQRCRVRFDDYNNEEELDVSNLMHLDELHGPSRVRVSSWKPSGTSSNLDWKRRREENQGERGGGGERRRREENQEERGGERRSAWRDEEQNSSRVKDRSSTQSNLSTQSNPSKVETEAEQKRRGNQQEEKPTNHSFSFFPPFPPPQSGSGESFISPPPPPPLWSAGGDSFSSMLMLWYMCGFHTGSYTAQQMFKSNSKD